MRRLLCLFLCLILMLFSVKAVNIEENITETTDDYNMTVTTEEKTSSITEKPSIVLDEQIINLLHLLGILEKENFDPNKIITRAEAAKLMINMSGIKDSDYAKGLGFYTDVPLTHPAAGYINACVQMGILNINENKLFNPDAEINEYEIIKMFVSLLGYDQIAMATGGYPSGYLSVALSKGITDDIKVDGILEPEETVIMVYNCLEVPLMRQVGFGSLERYHADKDITLLTEIFEIEVVNGQILENDKTSLGGSTSLSKNCINIDGKIYRNYVTNAHELLGYMVKAYVQKQRNGDIEIIFINKQMNLNNELELSYFDIIGFDEDKMEISYYKDDDMEDSVRLNNKLYTIYNGYGTLSYETAWFTPHCGSIKLLDINKDKVYDIVFFHIFDTIYVESVNVEKGQIVDKYGRDSIIFDKSSDKHVIINTKNGRIASLDDVYKNDVLSLAYSYDKQYLTIYMTSVTIEGKVDEFDASKNILTVDGTKYIVAKQYTELLSQPSRNKNLYDIVVGNKYIFHFDKDGEIAAIEYEDNIDYAYVITCAKRDGLNGYNQIRLLCSDGLLKDYELEENINLYTMGTASEPNAKKKSDDVIMKNWNEKDDNNLIKGLIKIELNSNNRIKSIYLPIDVGNAIADDKTDEELRFVQNVFSKDYSKKKVLNVPKSGALFDSGYRHTFDQRFSLGYTAKVFVIARDANGKIYPNNCRVTDYTYFGGNTYYSVDLYDISMSHVATVAVTEELAIEGDSPITNTTVRLGQTVTVIDKVTSVLNADGERVYKIYGWKDGKPIEPLTTVANLDKDIVADSHYYGESIGNLKAGDIIQFSVDTTGLVNAIRILLKYSRDGEVGRECYYSNSVYTDPDSNKINLQQAGDFQGDDYKDYTIIDNTTTPPKTIGKYYTHESLGYINWNTGQNWHLQYFSTVWSWVMRIDAESLLVNSFYDKLDGSNTQEVRRWDRFYPISNAIKTYKYNLEKNTLTPSNIGEIQNEDKLFVTAEWHKVKEIIIYR